MTHHAITVHAYSQWSAIHFLLSAAKRAAVRAAPRGQCGISLRELAAVSCRFTVEGLRMSLFTGRIDDFDHTADYDDS